jgi:putative protein kinase ArgK-like GTPase of G3E family
MAGAEQDYQTAPRGYEIVEDHWPYDGPYGHDHTTSAAEAIERLVRYLNNATGKEAGLPWPPTSYRVLSEVTAAARGLDQLLRQIGERLELVDASKAYDDRRDRPAEQTIADVQVQLNVSLGVLSTLADHLSRAANHASHLGMSD